MVVAAPAASVPMSQLTSFPLMAHGVAAAPNVAVSVPTAPGTESATVTPVAFDGPAFRTAIDHVTGPPATAVPPVLSMLRSAAVDRTVVTEPVLSVESGSSVVAETVAVFRSEPVAAGSTVPVTVTVTVRPAAMTPIGQVRVTPARLQAPPGPVPVTAD